MFNFFKKKKPKAEEQEVQSNWHKDELIDSCVVYYIKEDGEVYVDVELRDYENSTINNFFTLIETLSHEASFLELLEVAKKGLLDNGKEDIFLELAIRLASKVNEDEFLKEEPCIRPSDVL